MADVEMVLSLDDIEQQFSVQHADDVLDQVVDQLVNYYGSLVSPGRLSLDLEGQVVYVTLDETEVPVSLDSDDIAYVVAATRRRLREELED
jgi:hypothetical protein